MGAQPLSRFNVFRSSDPAESEARLSESLCPHLLHGPTGVFYTVQNVAPLARTELVYVEYGASVQVADARTTDHYLLILPHLGRNMVEVGGIPIECSRDHAVLISPGRRFSIRSTDQAGSLIWRFHRDILRDQAERVLGWSCERPIDFSPSMSMAAGPAAALLRALRYAVGELERGDALMGSPRAADMFERAMIAAMLDMQPSDLGSTGQGGRSSVAPGCVRRVEAYVRCNLAEELTFADLTAASGVSARTLCRTFRRFRGVSPMEFVRDARLRAVRDALLKAGEGETVTSVLARHGVTQFGRFAAAYRARYGELPSQTRRLSA